MVSLPGLLRARLPRPTWTARPIKQDVTYTDRDALEKALNKLRRLPPIVTPTEICKLKKSLRDVALGKAFLLQGGDCAELFDYCEEGAIDAKIKLLLQMSLVLIWGANKPVVRIARMAGQFAKPRSSPSEIVDGTEIPSFRGDNINGFDSSERNPDPSRLVSAYFHSAATLNYVRAQLSSGIADLHSPLNWNLGHVQSPEIKAQYQRIVSSISDSLRFMRTVGADTAGQLQTVDLFTSHEGLLLEYEQSLTRKLRHPHASRSSSDDDHNTVTQRDGTGWYNTSAHFLWIGDRTRQPTHAHVEYFRGLENPIGIKVGPTMKGEELVRLLDILNPRKEVGKVTLITRYGEKKVEQLLGDHIKAVQATEHVVALFTLFPSRSVTSQSSLPSILSPLAWHEWKKEEEEEEEEEKEKEKYQLTKRSNTTTTPTGIKTRSFSSIYSELASSLRIHKAHGSFLGGVHLELTGDAVTECIGGSEGLTNDDLAVNYTSFCDPRLNEKQALELAFLIAGHYRGEGGRGQDLGVEEGR
ncbi:MAG: hypothetical protein M1838_000325 [Thelocarpon superellum]|nr:MAG: hypothetical protein M1838_000325 [Thelocarpon superellum]